MAPPTRNPPAVPLVARFSWQLLIVFISPVAPALVSSPINKIRLHETNESPGTLTKFNTGR